MTTISHELDISYYGRRRHDVLRFIPDDVRSVLSIGCGSGATEGALIERGCRVTAVEINDEAIAVARQRGIEVIPGDASDSRLTIPDGPYDCLLYADVLEHLRDPISVLRRHVPLLSESGRVVISVPNFRHYSVLWDLAVRGHIRYRDAGILDRTHLRMTTRAMVMEWFAAVGLRQVAVKYNMARRTERYIAKLGMRPVAEFVASQVILVGQHSNGTAVENRSDSHVSSSDPDEGHSNVHPTMSRQPA